MRRRVLILLVYVVLSFISSFAFAQSPQISTGLSWLSSAQTPTGSWEKVETTEYYSTATALDALFLLDITSSAYTTGEP